MSKGNLVKKVPKDEDGRHTNVLVLDQAGVLLTGQHTEGVCTKVITLSNS